MQEKKKKSFWNTLESSQVQIIMTYEMVKKSKSEHRWDSWKLGKLQFHYVHSEIPGEQGWNKIKDLYLKIAVLSYSTLLLNEAVAISNHWAPVLPT